MSSAFDSWPSCRDHSLTEPQHIQLFTIELGEPLRTDVALQCLTSLDEAVMFVHAYEQRSTTPIPPLPKSLTCSIHRSWSATASSSVLSVMPSSAPALTLKTTTSMLLSVEITNRHAKGLFSL
jgi:hypothetical protein